MTERSGFEKIYYGFVAIIFLVTITITFYSDTQLPKMASMTIIPFTLITMLVKPDVKRIKTVGEFPAWLIIGLLLTYVLSVIVWLLNIEQTMYISTGTKRIAFYMVNVLVAFCAVYMFGSKAIDYTLYGAFMMNSYFVLTGIMKYGVSQSINDLINTFKTGDQSGFMHITEVNNITFVYGFFIVYYLFISDYSKKRRAILISCCAFFVIMGFKRINLASIAVGLTVLFIFYKLPERFKKHFLFTVASGAAFVIFMYIPIIRYGWFEYLMNKFNVNTNTRTDLYNFVKNIYEFKPTFIGQGIDYVMRYLEYLKSIRVYYKGASLKYIHNDILVKYIEMGFWGFIGWLYAMCIFGLKWMNKHCGIVVAGVYVVISVINFINISTGNTNHDYCVRLVIEIILTGIVCKTLFENKQDQIDEQSLISEI